MGRVSATVLCALLATAGCQRGGQDQAFASAKSAAAPGTATEGALEACPLLPRQSMLGYVPPQTLVYISFPDVAATLNAVANSPLKVFWKNAALADALSAHLGQKNWQWLQEEAGKAAQGLYRGSIEIAVASGEVADDPFSPVFYIAWAAQGEADGMVRRLADFVVALGEKVPELSYEEMERPEGMVRSVTFNDGEKRTFYFAAVNGTVRISNDQQFFGALTHRPKSLRNHPPFVSLANRVAGEGTPLAFCYANTEEILALATRSLPVPSHLWAKAGLAQLTGVALASYQRAGSVREVFYFDWPEESRGLLSPLFRPANVKGVVAVVPAEVSSFGVGGIDWKGLWEHITGFAADVFPPAADGISRATSQVEGMLGVSVPALLGCLGTDFASYTLVRPGKMPANVMLLALENPDVLRRALAQLEKNTNQRFLLESVDAIPIFATPAPTGIHFAVCEQYLGISQDLEALRDFVRNRQSRPRPLAERTEVRDILAQKDLAGFAYLDLGQQITYLTQMGLPQLGAMASAQSATPLPIEDIVNAFRDLSTDVGQLWALTFLEKQGLRYELRSTCGLLPFAASAGAVAGAVAIPAVVKGQERERENAVVQAVRSVAAAQEIFRARNGRYAQNLWELRRALIIDAELGRGCQDGYLFRVRSSGSDTWASEVRPSKGRGRHYYCDQTGIIRAEANKPAGTESPVATGGNQ